MPDDVLHNRLRDAYGDRLLYLRLVGFDLEETIAYFSATKFGREVSVELPEMVEKIHVLSDGRPILVALALDWLKRGMWDPHLYPLDVAQLRQWKTQPNTERQATGDWKAWEDVKHRFEAALIGQARNLATPLDVAITLRGSLPQGVQCRSPGATNGNSSRRGRSVGCATA